jgi:hypothetical protein
MGIQSASNIQIIRRTVKSITPVGAAATPEEIIEDSDTAYPSVIGKNSQLGDYEEELWRDYLLGAKLRTDSVGKFKYYALSRSRSECEYFLDDLGEKVNLEPRDAHKSIGNSTSFGKYDSIRVQSLRVEVGHRIFKADIWQKFEDVDSKHFVGTNPTGRFRIDITDAGRKLYMHSDMTREKNGRLDWIVTPEPVCLEKEGARKYFDRVNDILNQLVKA